MSVSFPYRQFALWYRRLDGDTTPRLLAKTNYSEWAPRFSPDGQWVAFASYVSGAMEACVQSLSSPGALIPVSAGGGATPVWGRDGKHLYYVSGNRIHAASVSTTPTFALGRREPVPGSYHIGGADPHANFDVSPDGQHFLLLGSTSTEAQTIIVHDWQYELRERLAQAGRQ